VTAMMTSDGILTGVCVFTVSSHLDDDTASMQ
jgi:hypothetical protein